MDADSGSLADEVMTVVPTAELSVKLVADKSLERLGASFTLVTGIVSAVETLFEPSLTFTLML